MSETKPPSFLSRALSELRKAVLPPSRQEVARPQRGSWPTGSKADEVFQGKEPFLSPGSPLDPKLPPGEAPRRFQYQPGYNLAIQPRSTEQITFAQLRAVSEYTMIRIIIEHVKESMKAHEWDIVPVDRDDKHDYEEPIKMLKEFFEMPDRLHAWDEWLGMLIEEVLVPDAFTVYKRLTRGGDLYALEIIDGTTIKVLSDSYGFEPRPPYPAYQQFLYGVPNSAFTRDEMYYLPRNRRTHKFYGYSPIEAMIVTVNQGLRRELYSLAQLSDGNIPPGVGELPKEWKLEEIKAFQETWDLILAGDPQNRSRIRFVPEGFNYTKLHDGTDGDGMGIFSPFDEWLARILCFGVGISPLPFIKMTNRSVAEEFSDVESEGGVASMKLFIERFVNRVIKYDFEIPHLCFNWVTDRSRTQAKRVNRNVAYVNAGIFQIDEVRAEEGLDPLGLPIGYPTPAGYKTFEGAIAQEEASVEGMKAQTEATIHPPKDPNAIAALHDPAKDKDNHGKPPKDDQAKAIRSTRDSKADKAWQKCRLEELDKWERFALAREGKVEKMIGFEPEYIDEAEAGEIRDELLTKTFKDDIKHVFEYRRAKVQPVRLAPAAARDAAHHAGDLSRVLTSAFQAEAQRIARDPGRVKKVAAQQDEPPSGVDYIQPIYLTVPRGPAIEVKMPDVKPPDVFVTVPVSRIEVAAPVVHVENQPAVVNVPAQAAPIVNVEVKSPDINIDVKPADVVIQKAAATKKSVKPVYDPNTGRLLRWEVENEEKS